MNNQLFPNRLMYDERQNPVVSRSESEDFPLSVAEHADGTLSIEWDENDPRTSVFNNWTNEDFVDMLRRHLDDTTTLLLSKEDGGDDELTSLIKEV